MIFQIERNTRQWLGTLAVGGVIGALILTGKIPPAEYKHWEGLIIGAFFYHIVKMLNAPVSVSPPGHIGDATKMVPTANPTQPPKEG